MNIELIKNQILVEATDSKQAVNSQGVITQVGEPKEQIALVVKVGNLQKYVKAGELVCFPRPAGKKILIEEKEYVLIPNEDFINYKIPQKRKWWKLTRIN